MIFLWLCFARYCGVFRSAVVCRNFHAQCTDLVLLSVICSTTLLTQPLVLYVTKI
jgi:hypothetical protein